MISYADVDLDLVPRFPRALTDDEEERAKVLIQDASFWLSVWVPGLDDSVTSGDEQAVQAARLLVIAMVKRSLLSPTPETPGVQSMTNTAGIYTETVTYRNPEGNLYLYDRELSDITALLRPNRASAVSMRSPGL